jgi:hypothetical protein
MKCSQNEHIYKVILPENNNKKFNSIGVIKV